LTDFGPADHNVLGDERVKIKGEFCESFENQSDVVLVDGYRTDQRNNRDADCASSIHYTHSEVRGGS